MIALHILYLFCAENMGGIFLIFILVLFKIQTSLLFAVYETNPFDYTYVKSVIIPVKLYLLASAR